MFGAEYRDWAYRAAPEYGGNLCRLCWKGHDLLRFPETPELLRDTPELYGIPVLFPPGRIDGGEFLFRGRRCFLPVNEPARNTHLHGLALRRAWHVPERKENTFTLEMQYGKADPEFAGYPFPFSLHLQYIFRENLLEQNLTVENHGSEPMPFGAGFHTVLTEPRKAWIPEAGCWEMPPPRLLGTGRKVPWSEGFVPDRPFGIAELPHSYNFEAPAGPHKARFDMGFCTLEYGADAKFRTWCIWAPGPQCGFLAAEPYSCFSGAFNTDPEGILVLAPGARECFHSEFRILPAGTPVSGN